MDRRWIVLVVALVLVSLWIAGTREEEERVGDDGVYQRIQAETDCGELQATFDRAADNNEREEPGTFLFDATLGYMRAADDRMEALGCYG